MPNTRNGATVRPGRGAVERLARGSSHGSPDRFRAGTAGRTRVCHCVGNGLVHRAGRIGELRPDPAGAAGARAQGCPQAGAQGRAEGRPRAARPPQAPAPQAQPGEQPQLIFSPWTKFCLKGQEANAKQVCFTGKDGRVESGMPVVAAVLIEPEGDPKKVLRVTLPLGMSIQPGTRVIVDSGQPMTGPYVICFNNGCMADYEASAELIGKLKKGQGLVVQGINGAGQPISLVVPLGDFAKAYDGPPTDPKEFEDPAEEASGGAREARRGSAAEARAATGAGHPVTSPLRKWQRKRGAPWVRLFCF